MPSTSRHLLFLIFVFLGTSCVGGEIASHAKNSSDAQDSRVRGAGISHGLECTFDEAAGDVAGSGVLCGAPLWVSGKVNTALHFDGVSQWVQQDTAAVDTSKSFSLSAWTQLERSDVPADFFVTAGNNVPSVRLRFLPAGGANNASILEWSVSAQDTNSSVPVAITATAELVMHNWYHLAATYDAEQKVGSLYLNGALVGRGNLGSVFASQGPTYLAGGGTGFDKFDGRIDELSVVEGVMDANYIQASYAAAASITPLRPPAVPLVVRSPYLNVWQGADTLNGSWPSFWTGTTKAMTGMLRVDGQSYVVIGTPNLSTAPKMATQTQLEMTPTQSRYAFLAGGVGLHLNFISPVEPNDLKQMSIPASVIEVQAVALDGNAHSIQWYTDITAEWSDGSVATEVTWAQTPIQTAAGTLAAFTITQNTPHPLAETNDAASWGSVVWASEAETGTTFQAGQDIVVRNNFVAGVSLDGSVDSSMPRAINNAWPTFAFVQDWGHHVTGATAVKRFALGHVRTPAVSYQGAAMSPFWLQYWSSWQAMVADFYQDAASGKMLLRAVLTDQSIMARGVAAGGPHYAALLALAFRQAFGGVELVGTLGNPWLFLKEISSDGNLSTVDVIYPMFPILLRTNPELLRYVLEPVFAYAESGSWPNAYCEHDLGSSYPNASGHNDGGGENMPVEESANMLLMATAYLRSASNGQGADFATKHYAVMQKWADYLVANTLDPGYQNQTDDFTGFIAHSSNLALKGILALGGMAQLADAAQHASDATHYSAVAQSYISQWYLKSLDPSGKHLKLAYDQNNTWSLKYNAFVDRLLDLQLVPSDVYIREGDWYASQQATYGVPLDNRHSYTKNDWEMFVAASSLSQARRQSIVDGVYAFVNQTQQRVPATDLYETQTAAQVQFQARPVIGGWFALIDLVSYR